MTNKKALAIGGGLAALAVGGIVFALSPHDSGPAPVQASQASPPKQYSVEDIVMDTCSPGGYTDGYGVLGGHPVSKAVCVDPAHGSGQVHYAIYATEFEALNAVAMVKSNYPWYTLDSLSTGKYFVMAASSKELLPFEQVKPSSNL